MKKLLLIAAAILVPVAIFGGILGISPWAGRQLLEASEQHSHLATYAAPLFWLASVALIVMVFRKYRRLRAARAAEAKS